MFVLIKLFINEYVNVEKMFFTKLPSAGKTSDKQPIDLLTESNNSKIERECAWQEVIQTVL